jgi:stage III sporulation protein AB
MMVSNLKKEERELRHFLTALDFMQCELQYRLTPLPQLCRRTSDHGDGCICKVLDLVAEELENQIAPDVQTCMHAALQKAPRLPPLLYNNLLQLGCFLGRFDLPGQIQGIETVRQLIRQDLSCLCENKDTRYRCYQTLGLCAGSALVVLFL